MKQTIGTAILNWETPSRTPSLHDSQENVKIPHAIDFALAEPAAPPTVDDLRASAIANYLYSDLTAGEVMATDAMLDDIIQGRISDIENALNVILGKIDMELDLTSTVDIQDTSYSKTAAED